MNRATLTSPTRLVVGVLLGLAVSAVVLSALESTGGRSPAPALPGPVLSDCDGPIRELVIHYVRAAAPIVGPTYRDFLRQLPADVEVHVVCPDRAAFDDLLQRVGPTACTVSPVVVDHALTPWSRDRWLALAPGEASGRTTLLCPRAEMGAEIWRARAGDQAVGDDLAAALSPSVACVRSELFFDGGDFVADGQTVFVTPAVLLRNLQQTLGTRAELIERLRAVLGREVVLLDTAPDHHAGMFMMAVGDRTVLVGDPRAAKRLLDEAGAAGSAGNDSSNLCPPSGPDFSAETIARFDAVAQQCAAAGYRVQRMPTVPGRDGRTYVTYLNVVLDQRAGRRIVYMPVYSGADCLNREAEQVWRGLGYEVRPVDCDGCYPHFGSLRCVVNVLRRG